METSGCLVFIYAKEKRKKKSLVNCKSYDLNVKMYFNRISTFLNLCALFLFRHDSMIKDMRKKISHKFGEAFSEIKTFGQAQNNNSSVDGRQEMGF